MSRAVPQGFIGDFVSELLEPCVGLLSEVEVRFDSVLFECFMLSFGGHIVRVFDCCLRVFVARANEERNEFKFMRLTVSQLVFPRALSLKNARD